MAGFLRGARNVATLVPGGYFAFMDYVIPQWLRHLELGIAVAGQGRELVSDLQESLELFLNIHFMAPIRHFAVSQVAVISKRKELTLFGEMKENETALDLADIVKNVREAIKIIHSNLTGADDKAKMEQIYGQNIFKCPRFSCRYFCSGFGTADQRNQHIDKHLRPFRCTIVGCPSYNLGMNTEKDLIKPTREEHGIFVDDELDLPDPDEKKRKEPKPNLHRVPQRPVQPEPYVPEPKITEFPCKFCPKVFNKKYNLIWHQVVDRRDYRCTICFTAFARDHDRRRHEKTQEDKKFICRGTLGSGQRWGCQKEFARADTAKPLQHCLWPRLYSSLAGRARTAAGTSGSAAYRMMYRWDGSA
ncbi:putative C2H2-type domain-containing protein [Seiridium cardinale]|uniref:C2H2-type domain-containing protein n=1 Tax=Seiridium cardinale TaxID=138064 RepID=A0ABR2Y9L1_9PEZI